jgi:hypothetical protein
VDGLVREGRVRFDDGVVRVGVVRPEERLPHGAIGRRMGQDAAEEMARVPDAVVPGGRTRAARRPTARAAAPVASSA